MKAPTSLAVSAAISLFYISVASAKAAEPKHNAADHLFKLPIQYNTFDYHKIHEVQREKNAKVAAAKKATPKVADTKGPKKEEKHSAADHTFKMPIQMNLDNFNSLNNAGKLHRRANGNCPNGAFSCASAGHPAFCCPTGTQCALDDNRHIACCPNGQSCSGSLGIDGNNNCRDGWYSCKDTFANGCCLSGIEFCGNGQCVAVGPAIAPIVSGIKGLYTSAANGAVGVYRSATDSAGQAYTTFVGDAGEVYTSFRDDFRGAESWVGGQYTGATAALGGAFATATAAVGSAANDAENWYRSVTSRFGAGVTSYLSEGGVFVTSVATEVAGVLTTQAITLTVPTFADSMGTAGFTNQNAAGRMFSVMGREAGPALGMLIWAWAMGLGFFVGLIGIGL